LSSKLRLRTGWRSGTSGALAVVLILGLCPFATGAEAEKAGGSFARAFRMTPAVLGRTLASPAHWKGSDFLKLSAVLGAGLVLGLVDRNIRETVIERRTQGSKDFFGVVTRFGDGVFVGGFLAGLFATGAIAGSDGLKTTAWLGLESYLASSVFSTVLKFAVGRARPWADEGSHRFHPFSFRSMYTSMPSGHSTVVWSVATVIADRTDSVLVDIACYGAATLASLSRIHQDKHWASDVLIGSAIGYFTAKKICALNRNTEGPKLSASFGLAGRRQAVTLSLSF
jgi:membrane-associated phospholipid phosphatase